MLGNRLTIANNIERKGGKDNERVWLIEIRDQCNVCPNEEVHHDSDPPDGL